MPAKKPSRKPAKGKSRKRKPEPVIDEDFSFARVVEENVASSPEAIADALDIFRDLSPSEVDAIAELMRRQTEALELYRPLPLQDDFHKSEAPERIVWGSNRSGKTLSTMVELARAMTGCDPYDKYTKTDGRAIVVCESEDQIGQVIYKKLFKPTAFRIIRDLETSLWRAYNPSDPTDLKRKKESRWAPPLIPARLIAGISFEKKGEGILSQVRMTNGWEANFYSANGSPTPGTDVDLCVFDEEVSNEVWYEEMSARLIDRGGRFVWGATPQNGTPELYRLHERAVEEKKYYLGRTPKVEEFRMLMANNPYMGAEEKSIFESKLTEAQKLYRVHGEFVITTYRVYDEFNPEIHCVDPFDIRPDWTHYMIVDPGRQVCAVLFAVAPPPEHPKWGGRVILYEELYIRQCTAWIFGEKVAPKVTGRNFQAFIIDRRGGRLTEIGGGQTPQQRYENELAARNIKSTQSGSSFLFGNDHIESGILAAKAWLEPAGGKPVLAVFTTMQHFLHEIKYYHNRKKKGELVDTPEQRNSHLMDCFRYASSHGCHYVQPKSFKAEGSYAYKAFQAKVARQKEKNGSRGVSLGPSS